MTEEAPEQRDGALTRLARLLKPHALGLTLVLGLLGLLALADMVVPFFLKLLFDDVFPSTANPEGNRHLLWVILPGFVLIFVARNTIFYVSRMRSTRISEDVCFDLRKRLFEHLQRLSLSFYRTNQPGQVSARLMDDTFKIQTFIQDKLPTLLRYAIEFQVLLVVIYVVNWRLALVSSIVLPLLFVTYRYFRRPIRQSHSEAQESLAQAHGNVVEQFLGMEVVKGFSAEERESHTFRAAIDASRRKQIRSQRLHFLQKVAADLSVGLGTVILLGYGAWQVLNGTMAAGSFLMFFLYVKMLYPAALEVISGAGHLSRAAASVDRVHEILGERADELGTAEGLLELAELKGHIAFRDVGFAYDPAGSAVLRNLDLTIPPGEHVAITGPSGSGKSTLISLPPRFNDPTTGQVLIDDRPTHTIAIQALRKLFGLVFQEVFLFNTTILENLRYASPEASMDTIVEACRITGAHEFIERLPDGYYTRLGETGGELSRGEKQRITLARALVRDPQILIMDEATASIDESAAAGVVRSILERMKGRTVIMVTHQSELINLADRVIVIEGGRATRDCAPDQLDLREHSATTTYRFNPNVIVEPAPSPPPRTKTEPAKSGPVLGLVLALSAAMLCSCVNTEKTTHDIDVEQPKVSGGVLLDEPDPEKLDQIAEALDRLTLNPDGLNAESIPALPGTPTADDVLAEMPDVLTPENVARTLTDQNLPAGVVRLVGLPKLSGTELREVAERLVLRLNSQFGYTYTSPLLADSLPPGPTRLENEQILTRTDGNITHILRFAHRNYVTQPPQLWVMGLTLPADGTITVNADLDTFEPMVTELITSLNEYRAGLTVRDLEAKTIQLSYTDASTALAMLRGMGMTTLPDPAQMPADVDFATLPYVVMVPDPKPEDIGLIGSGQARDDKDYFKLSVTPNIAGAITPNNIASPMTQLLVMFHPAHPEQFSSVRRLLDEFIDRPARQIFIEGMVLEISEDGLKDLGIEWEMEEFPISIRAGSPRADGTTDTLEFEDSDLSIFSDIFRSGFEMNWEVRIRALIQDGKAEILSRPSVLTLNNRQSTIRVGEDIPIATSQEGYATSSNRIAFSFQYLPTGILLNIRPRINEDGSEVSMLIDTIVSARVPGGDLEMRSADGTVLATAPTVSTRRVQTYGRIRNNTPFIIGGLVARLETQVMDKVPLLGDLWLIGGLFRAERTVKNKREVIIVLTPYVLPEEKLIPRSLPKDEDFFDSFDHILFRDSYRIRSEDVFDLDFLVENERLTRYRELAGNAIGRNFRLAEKRPFEAFAGDRIPGEDILVTRMIYEVIKRLDLADPVNPERVIFFEDQQAGGYDVRFLQQTLEDMAGARFSDPFRKLKGRAVAFTYYYDREAQEPGRLASEPIPEVTILECPDREAWANLLWDLNQPTPDGRQRYTVLLNDPSDLLRLRRALALKRVVSLNGGDRQLLMRNFSAGKVLLIPEMKGDQIHVIDADVAKFFFHTEHYYAATITKLEHILTELDAALRGNGHVIDETPPEAPSIGE